MLSNSAFRKKEKTLEITICFVVVLGLAGVGWAEVVVSDDQVWNSFAQGGFGGELDPVCVITETGLLVVTERDAIKDDMHLIVAGGDFVMNARLDMDSLGKITIYAGAAAFPVDFKFPDSNGTQDVELHVLGGTASAYQIENRAYDRGRAIYVGGGTLTVQTGYLSGSREYDPNRWLADGTLLPAQGYGQVVLTDLGDGAVQITATPEPPEFECTNIGIGSIVSCRPDDPPTMISSQTDSVGNALELWCNGAFLLQFIRPGDPPCNIGFCSYRNGENAGWACRGPGGEFTRVTWLNFEGHKHPRNPGSEVDDWNLNGEEDRDTYIYDVASNTLTITNHTRGLTNKQSDPGKQWVWRYEHPPYHCPTSSSAASLFSTDEVQFISNVQRVTPLQFVGEIQGGGQVIVAINGVQVVVPTDDGMDVQQLAQQLVQLFNERWGQEPLAQQTKSASQDPNFGQIVRLHNVAEQELQVQILGEQYLGFNYYAYPQTNYSVEGDINYDARVNFVDLASLAGNWLIPPEWIPQGLPDLVPVKAPGNPTFCEVSGSDLVVYVKNQGNADAAGSEIEVRFSTDPGVFVKVRGATGPISPGDTDTDYIPIPAGCNGSDCHFTITVDIVNTVRESNESNNSVKGACIG
ncbi:MAG: CARDB domain-containing protein [Planctomycetota bacterium]|jgi:hypothetical protein